MNLPSPESITNFELSAIRIIEAGGIVGYFLFHAINDLKPLVKKTLGMKK